MAGLALGGAMGALALTKKSTVNSHCNSATLTCDKEGMDALDSGRTFGLVSTIGFGVGGAGIATAIVLMIAGGGDKEPAAPSGKARVRPMLASPKGNDALLGVQGTW